MIVISGKHVAQVDYAGDDEDFLFAMEPALEPLGEARDDYDIFAGLAARLGVEEAFTEGRTSEEWVRHFYESFHAEFPEYPTYEEFRAVGHVHLPQSRQCDLER